MARWLSLWFASPLAHSYWLRIPTSRPARYFQFSGCNAFMARADPGCSGNLLVWNTLLLQIHFHGDKHKPYPSWKTPQILTLPSGQGQIPIHNTDGIEFYQLNSGGVDGQGPHAVK
jgi:hypothetical protein